MLLNGVPFSRRNARLQKVETPMRWTPVPEPISNQKRVVS